MFIAACVQADITTVTLPPYWTGTYNLAVGTTIGGPYVAAQLIVNGVVVRNHVFEDEAMQHLSLAVTVDSTHFQDGQQVAVTMWALRLDGVAVSGSNSVTVKNRSFAWELPEFAVSPDSHSSDNVQSLTQAAGWNASECHTPGWTASSLRSILEGTGVHYVNSHGTIGQHRSDHSWLQWDGIQWLTMHEEVYADNYNIPNNSYMHMRRDQVGDYDANPSMALPPFNPSGVPQITFAFIDACDSGTSGNLFSSVLYPYRIYTFPVTTDQAVLTWAGYSNASKADRMNQELWSRLAAKKTIGQARQEMMDAQVGLSRSELWYVISQTYPNIQWVAVTSNAQVPAYGDLYTRIHGVYTGDNVNATTDWYL